MVFAAYALALAVIFALFFKSAPSRKTVDQIIITLILFDWREDVRQSIL
ncbi:hypothetical protein [Salmonella enterica]|nr:hypothetical protein [Salmonella enterica]